MQILYNNLIDGATVSASSVQSGYPIENIQDYHLSKKYSSDATSGSITIDLGSAQLIDDFTICGTNITSSATTFNLEGSDDGGTADVTFPFVLHDNGYATVQDMNSTYRYWKIVYNDTTIPTFLVGYVFLGTNLQMPGVSPDVSLQYKVNTGVQFSVTNQTYSDTGIQYFSSSFNFPHITDYPHFVNGKATATRNQIVEFWQDNQGAKPIVLYIWADNFERFPPVLGMITQNSMDFKFDKTQSYTSMKFNFTETL